MTAPTNPRELDAAIAERLFGWRREDKEHYSVLRSPDAKLVHCIDEPPGTAKRLAFNNDMLPAYSSDWSAAGLVVEALKERFSMVSVNWGATTGWWCTIYPYVGPYIEGEAADSGPMAVAVAALAALRATSGEDGT